MKHFRLSAVALWAMVGIVPVMAADLQLRGAMAADLPVKAAPYSNAPLGWGGLYLEGFGLWGADVENANLNIGGITAADLAGIPNGPGIGGAIGYNFQLSPNGLVIGGRLESSWVNFKGSGNIANEILFSNATDYLGAVNVVVLLPLSPDGRFAGYLTGGFAWGGINPSLTITGGASSAIKSTSTGYDLGGGFAYQFTPNWSAFIELDWYKLGDKSITVLGDVTATAKVSDIVQKVGIAYKFATY